MKLKRLHLALLTDAERRLLAERVWWQRFYAKHKVLDT